MAQCYAKTPAQSKRAKACRASGCRAGWCYHDSLINRQPFNPLKYDLADDYTTFTAPHGVVVEYLSKAWAFLAALAAR